VRLITGLTVVAAAGLLAGFGPVETRAGQLLQLDAGAGPAPSSGYPSSGSSSSGSSSAAAPAAPDPVTALTATDRDLLTRVRLAGLWEIPAGRMAAQKGVNPRVRQIGAEIAEQHHRLDALVVAAAKKVNLLLPDEPNADQQFWLGEMRRAQGAAFDEVFVSRLRSAHGKVFPAIASARVGTHNPVVSGLANSANGFVLNHLNLLESTDLVNYRDLPPAPEVIFSGAPAPSDYRPSRPAPGDPPRMLAAWAVLGLAVVTGALGLARLLSPRLFGHPARLAGPTAPPATARAMDGLAGY
jgi:predicted outer membrane protein